MTNIAYLELETTTNFSFLRGASHAEELVNRAAVLGHRGATVTDCNTLAGVVRGHAAAKECGLPFVPGCRLVPEDGPDILAFPRNRVAYGRLSQILTLGNRRAPKGGDGDCPHVIQSKGAGVPRTAAAIRANLLQFLERNTNTP